MCGRARQSLAPEQVAAAAQAAQERWVDRERYRPSHNLAPGAWTPVVRTEHDGQRTVQTMRWGLVPSYTKPTDKPDVWRMFNARSETVDSKGVFKRLLGHKRCVVLMEGFYEWKADAGGRKQPYYVTLDKGEVMRMAGLYDSYQDDQGERIHTFTILTTDASPRLEWLHNRMPAILRTEEDAAAWLGEPEALGKALGSSQQQGSAKQGAEKGDDETQEKGTASAGAGDEGEAGAVEGEGASGKQGRGTEARQQEDAAEGQPKGSVKAGTEEGTVSAEAQAEGAAGDSEGEGVADVVGKQGKDEGSKEEAARAIAEGAALLSKIIRPYNGEDLLWWPVTPAMSKMSYQSPDACKDTRTAKGAISNFFKPLGTVHSSPGKGKAGASSKTQGGKAGGSGKEGPLSGAAAGGEGAVAGKEAGGDASAVARGAGSGKAAKEDKAEPSKAGPAMKGGDAAAGSSGVKPPGGDAVRNTDDTDGAREQAADGKAAGRKRPAAQAKGKGAGGKGAKAAGKAPAKRAKKA